MYKLLLIALGGAVGTLARYGTHVLASGAGERLAFPVATLIVNLLGCFAIGYLGATFDRTGVREEYRLMVVVGVFGGFTTFSTFGWDAVRLLREDQAGRAIAYVLATNIAGIALVFAGYTLSRLRA